MGIVIVDDDIEIDQEKVNEERRAYLEEAGLRKHLTRNLYPIQ